MDWEYVELARSTIEDAPTEEGRQIAMLRASGARLFNKNAACRSPARPEPPVHGKSGKTLLKSRKVYATAEEFEQQDKRMRAAGFSSWSDYARKTL